MTTTAKFKKPISIDSAFPWFDKISSAPSLSDLESRAARANKPLYEILEEESRKLYKAYDSKNDRIVLIQNPSVWEFTSNARDEETGQLTGPRTYYRPTEKLPDSEASPERISKQKGAKTGVF